MIHVKKDLIYLDYFSAFADVIAIEAILGGTSKGELYLDNEDDPKILIIWNGFDGFYLVSDVSHLVLAHDFILETVKTSDFDEFVVYMDRHLDSYKNQVIPAESFNALEVLYYTSEAVDIDKTSEHQILDIQTVDLSLLNAFEDIQSLVVSTWSDYETFEKYGYGYVSLLDNCITGDCISEHVTDKGLEFSIEVDEKHHRKGIGYGLGKAMLDKCFSEGKEPAWYCTDDNSGSMSLAEKLGLNLKSKFHVWYFNKSNVNWGINA